MIEERRRTSSQRCKKSMLVTGPVRLKLKSSFRTDNIKREKPSNILNIDNSKSGWLHWCVPSWTQTINQRGIPEHLVTISPRRELGTNLSTEQNYVNQHQSVEEAAVTAWGEKLLQSVVDVAQMIQDLHPTCRRHVGDSPQEGREEGCATMAADDPLSCPQKPEVQL